MSTVQVLSSWLIVFWDVWFRSTSAMTTVLVQLILDVDSWFSRNVSGAVFYGVVRNGTSPGGRSGLETG